MPVFLQGIVLTQEYTQPGGNSQEESSLWVAVSCVCAARNQILRPIQLVQRYQKHFWHLSGLVQLPELLLLTAVYMMKWNTAGDAGEHAGREGKKGIYIWWPSGSEFLTVCNKHFFFLHYESAGFVRCRNKTVLHQSKDGKESGHLSCVCFTVFPG